MSTNTFEARKRHLNDWANYLVHAARAGHLGNKAISIQSPVRSIAGPRVGGLELRAGVDAGRLLKALTANDLALLRQYVPWDFSGSPVCYMSGRYVRIEAGWSADLAQGVIRLRDVNRRPQGAGRWLAGQNERGSMVAAELNDRTPHFLLAGQSGGGKSVAIQSSACQLGQDPDNRLIMIDGKWGDGLLPVAHLSTLQGPLALDIEDAEHALAWAMSDMRRRYEQKMAGNRDPSRLVIFWDEPQEWLKDNARLAAMTRRLSGQGRAVGVHFLIATHHPTNDMFGDKTSKRNLSTGRIALQVADFDASRVAIGAAKPRADHLRGAGDSYLIGPGSVQRAQLVYVDERDFDALPAGKPLLEQWPDYQVEDWGRASKAEPFTPEQTAEALIVACQGKGRPTLEQRAGVGSTV
ncbi:MAG: hypothetical protein GY824_26725, partial [Delftia sp.]|nr:hypothetical protein [Delftia sp.]